MRAAVGPSSQAAMVGHRSRRNPVFLRGRHIRRVVRLKTKFELGGEGGPMRTSSLFVVGSLELWRWTSTQIAAVLQMAFQTLELSFSLVVEAFTICMSTLKTALAYRIRLAREELMFEQMVATLSPHLLSIHSPNLAVPARRTLSFATSNGLANAHNSRWRRRNRKTTGRRRSRTSGSSSSLK